MEGVRKTEIYGEGLTWSETSLLFAHSICTAGSYHNISSITIVQIYFMCAYMSLYEPLLVIPTDLTKPAAFFSSARLWITVKKSLMARSDVCMCTTRREPAKDKGSGSLLARSATSAKFVPIEEGL